MSYTRTALKFLTLVMTLVGSIEFAIAGTAAVTPSPSINPDPCGCRAQYSTAMAACYTQFNVGNAACYQALRVCLQNRRSTTVCQEEFRQCQAGFIEILRQCSNAAFNQYINCVNNCTED